MPGSGITSANIIEVAEKTGAKELHSSASILKESDMQFQNAGMNESLKYLTTKEDEVKKMASLLRDFQVKH
jgi:copper homeostasis protein